jgi:hypothetical protein
VVNIVLHEVRFSPVFNYLADKLRFRRMKQDKTGVFAGVAMQLSTQKFKRDGGLGFQAL